MVDLFISYLEKQLKNHSIYVCGGQGQKSPVVNERWIRSMETSESNADIAVSYWKKQSAAGYGDVLRAFDCSGLGTFFFLQQNLIKEDMSADSLLRLCKKISFSELKPGDFVFKVNSEGYAYHIGYICDDKLNVIEARWRGHGVMKSQFKGWDVYGRPPFFRDGDGEKKSRPLKYTRPMMQGADVLALQGALKEHGANLGKPDGIFGRAAQKAVKNFQAQNGLLADGIAGSQTFEALGLKYIR